MTPDWVIQGTWFIAGVLATGAFWYFLAKQNNHATLWTGYFTIVFALLAVTLHIRNDFIRKGSADTSHETPVTPQPHPSPTGKSSLSQTMTDSPGGIQVGGNLTVANDKRLIQSLVLEIRVHQHTEARPLSEPQVDFGLQSAVALFNTSRERIRFVTDFRITDQQIDSDTRRLTFVYTPESPEQILGRNVEYLRDIDKLVVNFTEIFSTIGFATKGARTRTDLILRLNGIEVINETGGVDGSDALSKGQASFDVAGLFQKIPGLYEKRVSRDPR